MTRLADLAATSEAVGATTKRLAKRAELVRLLTRLDSAELAVAVAWLSGDLTQRQVGVGWAALRSLPPPAITATLTIGQVEATFSHLGEVAGSGSRQRRDAALTALFAAATPSEQTFLRRLLGGELRQGALAGVMTDAVAAAAGVPAADVRRAVMLRGDLPAVAAAARAGGAVALAAFGLVVGRPLAPMLAQPAPDIADALSRLDAAVLEWKLDGARIQVHRSGEDVAIFTRTLDDVTARLPEIVAAVRALPTRAVVLDGEAIALRADGSPLPFQVTASRFGRRTGRDDQSLSTFFFDVLHLDGRDLLDEPLRERSAVLDAIGASRPRRLVTSDPDQAQAFYVDTVTQRHEGIVAKELDSVYAAGRRGGAWLKVKPVHTLDLVVLAVEWGSGRREGWLSNLHLGARGPDGFVMLGKTFKGLTDALLRWQTARFVTLAVGPTDGLVVRVRPEQVVEIAFDGVQRSTRYPGGVALRFARVVRYRDDKRAGDADTLDAVRAFAGQSR